MRDPEVKAGMGVAISLLRALGREAGEVPEEYKSRPGQPYSPPPATITGPSVSSGQPSLSPRSAPASPRSALGCDHRTTAS